MSVFSARCRFLSLLRKVELFTLEMSWLIYLVRCLGHSQIQMAHCGKLTPPPREKSISAVEDIGEQSACITDGMSLIQKLMARLSERLLVLC